MNDAYDTKNKESSVKSIEKKRVITKETKKTTKKEAKEKLIKNQKHKANVKEWSEPVVDSQIDDYIPEPGNGIDFYADLTPEEQDEWIAEKNEIALKKMKEEREKIVKEKLKHGYLDKDSNDLGTTPHAGVGALKDYTLDDEGDLIKKN